MGTSKKGRLKLPAPSTGSAAVSFILQGLLCSWAHLSLKVRAAQKCGRINGPGYNITRRRQGQLYKCSSLLSFQRSRIEPRLPIVSAFITHPYVQFSFLSASLPAPSLTLPRITLPSELLNTCTQLCASGYAYRGPRLTQWSSRLFLCLSFFICKISKWNKNPFQLSHSDSKGSPSFMHHNEGDLFTLEEQTASFS